MTINGSARAKTASIARSAIRRSVLPFTAPIADASRFNIPENWIRVVMRAESFGDMRAVSPRDAMGSMQIIPKTYAGLRDDRHLGSAPNNPRDNILAGAAYLRETFDSYGSPGFLAAYNAGPARYEDHLATGRPLPVETLAYVALVHGYGRTGFLRSVRPEFPAAVPGSCRAVQISSQRPASYSPPQTSRH